MHRPPSLTRYDGLLAAMPASVAGGTAAGWWLAIPLLAGLGVGAGVAAVMILVSIAMTPTAGQKGSIRRSP
ncbi:hypothetical protein [Halonotius roseus]|uniref:Uncharacterized protein n=1 Tax=Halonotius roseus TaxID=2511997 RepID=A0A544QQ01_9EURY|nr:hypothetical protein [Halonotius roseus]TQQ81496.1 hypothetical protein EWF95_00695 [Halonotius roseus]